MIKIGNKIKKSGTYIGHKLQINQNQERFTTQQQVFIKNYPIGPTLKKIIKNNFNNDELLLHAGCGGGETDLFIKDIVKIHAIDISPNSKNIKNLLIKHIVKLEIYLI